MFRTSVVVDGMVMISYVPSFLCYSRSEFCFGAGIAQVQLKHSIARLAIASHDALRVVWNVHILSKLHHRHASPL